MPKPGPTFPGDVAPGNVRWGAAIGGNSDPARHEAHVDAVMGLRRTFFAWRHIDSNYLRNTAAADLAAGRLPWVSVKPLGSWADVAAGKHDASLDKLIGQLKALPGPVWFTVHHEPENDTNAEAAVNGRTAHGTVADWRNMQAHVSKRIDASGAKNIAFAPILMTWSFDPRSNRNPADWWVPGAWDFAGLDHYIDNNEAPTSVEGVQRWKNVLDFYRTRGMQKIAIGEWGNRGTGAVAASRMQAFYDHALASGAGPGPQIVGLAYFDSNLNSPTGGWELQGEPLQRFRQLMASSTSLGVTQGGW